MYSGTAATGPTHDAGVATVTQAGARPQGAGAGQPCRAGLARRPGHHHDPPAIALVRVARPYRQARAQIVALEQFDSRPGQRVDDARRYADVGDDHLAGPFSGRRHDQRDLQRSQGDRDPSIDAGADARPRVGREPTGQIDRHDRLPSRVHVRHHRGQQPFERHPNSGSDKRIDHEVGRCDRGPASVPPRGGGGLVHGEAELPGDGEVGARVAPELLGPGEQNDRDGRPPLRQHAGDDESVAPVAAAPAQDGHAPAIPLREPRFDRAGHGTTGVLHEDDRRNADLVDRAAVGIAHLGGIENAHRGFGRTASGSALCYE